MIWYGLDMFIIIIFFCIFLIFVFLPNQYLLHLKRIRQLTRLHSFNFAYFWLAAIKTLQPSGKKLLNNY